MRAKIFVASVFILILGVSLLTACGNKQEEALPPEPVTEGVDRCDVCNMLVPNDHNATQLILKDGRALKFDDIGCLVVWEKENGLDDVNVRYVRDYHTDEWVPMEEATYVYDANFRTPMAYGVYSFKVKEEAETFIQEQGTGKLMSFQELGQHEWTRNMELMQHHHHGHEHGEGEENQEVSHHETEEHQDHEEDEASHQ